MTWFEQSPNETEASKPHVAFFVAVDFDFPSGHARVWTGTGDMVFGGNTYLGIGTLGKIGTPAENNRLVAEQKVYQLSGTDPALVAESDIDGSFGRDVTEYFGFINPDTGALVAAPEVNWEGRIDGISRKDGKEPIIEVRAFHRLAALDRSSGWMYTHEHQQALFPGDNFFDQVPALALKTVVWGGSAVRLDTNNVNNYSGYTNY